MLIAELLSIFFAIASPFLTLAPPDFFTPPFARRRWVEPVLFFLYSLVTAPVPRPVRAQKRVAAGKVADRRLRRGCHATAHRGTLTGR